MKAILNLNGEKLSVSSISLNEDLVVSVVVLNEIGEFETYYNTNKANWIPKRAKTVDFNKTLEFPDIEQRIADERNKLIEHLEEMEADEKEMLTHIAVYAMEGNSLPFSELSLIESQRDYKERQQRVSGVTDTVEEVKAFTEGYYTNVDGEEVE